MSSNEILEFYLAPDYDARIHRVYVNVPDDWDDMTKDQREKFADEQAIQYRDEHVEAGGIIHTSLETAQSANRDSWGDQPDEAEDWF